jgi:hypothetical protein
MGATEDHSFVCCWDQGLEEDTALLFAANPEKRCLGFGNLYAKEHPWRGKKKEESCHHGTNKVFFQETFDT